MVFGRGLKVVGLSKIRPLAKDLFELLRTNRPQTTVCQEDNCSLSPAHLNELQALFFFVTGNKAYNQKNNLKYYANKLKIIQC